MAQSYTETDLEFICNHHRIVNYACAEATLHRMGLTSYADKFRVFQRVDVDHVHQGNRYWITRDIVDAGKVQLSNMAKEGRL